MDAARGVTAQGPPRRLPPAAALALFGLAYFGLCRLGDEWVVTGSEFATIWPAAGLLLAAFLVVPRARWPWVAAAVIAVEVAEGLAVDRRPFFIAANAAVDLLEASAGVWLVRRLSAGAPPRTARGLLALVIGGAVVAPALGGGVGSLALLVRQPATLEGIWKAWYHWWAGDGLGALVLAPALLAWRDYRVAPIRPARAAEAAALSAVLAAGAWVVFAGGLHLERSHLVLPTLAWAAFRFGSRGASAGLLLTAAVAAWGTSRAPAVLLPGLAAVNMQVQLLLAVAGATALLVAAALEEREDAVAALRRSERRFDAFVEHSPAPLLVRDRRGEVLAASRALAAAPGATLLPLVAEDARVLETGEGWRGDVVLGGRTYAAVKFRVPPEGAEPLLGVVGVDVTDQRNAERRAEAAERLASVGTLAAGMAHEINNPLTFIAANVAWAREALRLLPETPAVREAELALADAADGAQRVGKIVRDLKSVSRAPEPRHRPVALADEVQRALALCANETRHRARVTVRLGPAPPIAAPEFALGQVVLNLVVNAAHALPEGRAEANEIRVTTSTTADGGAAFEVSDTGPGIPPELRERLFEPFFTTKPVGQGTGLGLSVCRGIVEGLGGRIEVESEPGRGATFRVLLPPAVEDQRPESGAPARGQPAARRARILLIDDEPLVGKAVRRVLERHEVEVTTDARGALARIVAGERFDLVLCDLMMPDLTGEDFYGQLERLAPDAAPRVVFITGGAFSDRSRAFLERSRQPRIAKPFVAASLRAEVDALLVAVSGGGPPSAARA